MPEENLVPALDVSGAFALGVLRASPEIASVRVAFVHVAAAFRAERAVLCFFSKFSAFVTCSSTEVSFGRRELLWLRVLVLLFSEFNFEDFGTVVSDVAPVDTIDVDAAFDVKVCRFAGSQICY